MTDYRKHMGKKQSTPADTTEKVDDGEQEQKLVVNVDKLASKVLISSISGVATAIAIKAVLGNK